MSYPYNKPKLKYFSCIYSGLLPSVVNLAVQFAGLRALPPPLSSCSNTPACRRTPTAPAHRGIHPLHQSGLPLGMVRDKQSLILAGGLHMGWCYVN